MLYTELRRISSTIELILLSLHTEPSSREEGTANNSEEELSEEMRRVPVEEEEKVPISPFRTTDVREKENYAAASAAAAAGAPARKGNSKASSVSGRSTNLRRSNQPNPFGVRLLKAEQDKFSEFLCKALGVDRCTMYAGEEAKEGLFKVFTNCSHAELHNEKYEIDQVEMGDISFVSE